MTTVGLSTSSSHRDKGFTLVEVLIVMAIMAILAATAAPSLLATIASYQTRTVADELAISLAFAKNEGIRRGGRVIAQRLETGTNPCADAAGQLWSCGFVVFYDADGDGIQDANEPTLRNVAVPAALVVRNMSNTKKLTFDRWGQANGINALQIRILKTGASSSDTSVCVASGGRIRTVKGLVC